MSDRLEEPLGEYVVRQPVAEPPQPVGEPKRGRGRPRVEEMTEEDRAEVGEKQIDALIERRATSSSAHGYEPDPILSLRLHRQRAEEELRLAWYEHHLRLSDLHGRLCEEHKEKAARLLGGLG